MIYPRPEQKTLAVERQPAEGTCPECGGDTLERYPVLSAGGWFDGVKGQEGLGSVQRVKGPLLGPVQVWSSLLPDARS